MAEAQKTRSQEKMDDGFSAVPVVGHGEATLGREILCEHPPRPRQTCYVLAAPSRLNRGRP